LWGFSKELYFFTKFETQCPRIGSHTIQFAAPIFSIGDFITSDSIVAANTKSLWFLIKIKCQC
jgi:hypothetical protein